MKAVQMHTERASQPQQAQDVRADEGFGTATCVVPRIYLGSDCKLGEDTGSGILQAVAGRG